MNRKTSPSYWGFLAPALVFLIAVILIPFLMGVVMSFTNSDGFNMDFIGLDNYRRLLTDTAFVRSVWFTLRFAITSVLLVNIIGLFFAVLVTQNVGRVTVFFRTSFFTPNLIGGVLLGFIWQFIFNGAFTAVYRTTGWTFFEGWLSDERTAFWAMVLVFLWQMAGYIMLIYIAFLSNIPIELEEAAKLDGANSWQRFWTITLPQLAPAFTVSLFLTLSMAFKVYDLNLALTSGGPYRSSEVIAMNIYNTAFYQYEQGYAQAKGIIFLIIIAVIAVIQLTLTRQGEKRAR